jgi:hypothetical protein
MIPLQGFVEINRYVHSNLAEVSQSKFCGCETALSSSLGVGIGQLLILREETF